MGSTYKKLLVAVDTGLLLYWAAVFLNLIPEHLRFKDYSNQVIQAWNWSFMWAIRMLCSSTTTMADRLESLKLSTL